MKNPAKAFYDWYRNALRNPKYRWLIILGSLAYLVSPIDIAPDFIPIIGWIDDGVLATLLLTEVSSLVRDYLNSRKPTTATADAELEDGPVIDV
ncbi:DUF1232 domain-containing protein [Romeria aff. gracilis LEGE 07310]|uniref:DUF1232 domain-containing protein n=1 Tax=Vasconcelosia minhoensis LEGE 07310 TaxID=915328 RepID=A0A8J7AGL1_9CYAN|nr:YkvA family protein [Romeria gracilis]MBE9078509.1 DUF1232 domain-containing protein [Romeria aff. gracilis LEGE 07310]